MCIIIGKYFPDIGWVALKNRDRNYVPEISFKKKMKDGMEILYFWDDITQYCEGLNSSGIGILSASLMVMDDEKEIDTRAKTPSKDGIKIKKALTFSTLKEVVDSLVKQKLPGNTLIFDKNTMVLLEGAWEPGEYKNKKYDHVLKVIPKDEIIVRTNHGVLLDWAGYQRKKDDKSQTLSRISSESRKEIAEQVAKESKTPDAILDGLIHDFMHNGQLNPVRTTNARKKMRTTAQLLIIPSELTMKIRPVQSKLIVDLWDLNKQNSKTWVEILSNRIFFENLKSS